MVNTASIANRSFCGGSRQAGNQKNFKAHGHDRGHECGEKGNKEWIPVTKLDLVIDGKIQLLRHIYLSPYSPRRMKLLTSFLV